MAPVTRQGHNLPPPNTNTPPHHMTPESVQAMIDQALLRNSTNGDGSQSSHEDNPRHTLGPKAYAMNWEVHKKTMKLEIELWNLKLVPNESEKINKYISGLSDSIYRNVKSSKPRTLDETIDICERKPKKGKIGSKPDKNERRGETEKKRAAKAQNWKLPVCYDDDDDEERSDSLDENIISGLPPFFAITPDEPVLSTEEPDNSLSMGDEHLDTISATKSDEFIKSSVENLIPIPCESEGIPDHMCDVPSIDNSSPLDVSKDQIEDFSESNEELSSTDDDSFYFDNIDYVEASPPDPELISSEKNLEEKQLEKKQAVKAQSWKFPVCYDDDDDEESSNSLEDNIISELPPYSTVTPTEPIDSLSMGDEHLNTISATESDEFIKSCVENLVPNPSESEGENECDVPAGFTTFSNVLFDADYDSDSSDDQSLSVEDVREKIYSNPLFDEKIIPIEIDQHSLNAELGVLPEADHCQPLQYTVNHPIFNAHNDLLDSQNKLMEQMTSMCDMVGQFIQKKPEEKQIEEEQADNAQYWNIPACYDDDDDDYNFSITPNEPVNSLSMEDEHLDTVLAMESNEFIKSSVKNLVPNLSESEGKDKCDLPACFTTFSNILFNADYDFYSVDDQSLSDEDILKNIYSNPLFDEEIISMKIDPHHFNAESDLIEYMLNHDSLIISSSKIDSLFDEFAGELTLLKSISLRISETDCDHENEIRLTKRLLYNNSSPRPPEEFVYGTYDAEIKSFSPTPIPVEDSDSLMEEIDLSFTPDDPMSSGIEEDDYNSERDILILEELLDNYSFSLLENESFHFDTPSSSRPPAKPPDGNTEILNVKIMGDISEQKVPMPRLMITRVSNQEKSLDLLSHQGLEIF
nr:hypothetical protein [Tanacetum cinerariifolium]